jgi:glutaredoxin-related protein
MNVISETVKDRGNSSTKNLKLIYALIEKIKIHQNQKKNKYISLPNMRNFEFRY